MQAVLPPVPILGEQLASDDQAADVATGVFCTDLRVRVNVLSVNVISLRCGRLVCTENKALLGFVGICALPEWSMPCAL